MGELVNFEENDPLLSQPNDDSITSTPDGPAALKHPITEEIERDPVPATPEFPQSDTSLSGCFEFPNYSEPSPRRLKTGDNLEHGAQLLTSVRSNLSSHEFPQAQGTSSLEEMQKQRRKAEQKNGRGRKRREAVGECKDESQERLARNRVSARESRQRKKDYIAYLEAEVDRLKWELSQCKQKLVQCARIEAMLKVQSLDDYLLIKASASQQQAPAHSDVADESLTQDCNVQQLVPKMYLYWNERMQVVELLGQAMREILVPQHYKYVLWTAEHGTGLFDSRHVCTVRDPDRGFSETCGRGVSGKDEFLLLPSHQAELKDCASRLRMKMLQLVEAQQVAIAEMNQLNNYFMQQYVSQVSHGSIEAFLRWFDLVSCLWQIDRTKANPTSSICPSVVIASRSKSD